MKKLRQMQSKIRVMLLMISLSLAIALVSACSGNTQGKLKGPLSPSYPIENLNMDGDTPIGHVELDGDARGLVLRLLENDRLSKNGWGREYQDQILKLFLSYRVQEPTVSRVPERAIPERAIKDAPFPGFLIHSLMKP